MRGEAQGGAFKAVVVLVEPHHPGNIGATARAMANMGIDRLRLVRPCQFTKATRYMAWNATEIVDGAEFYDTLPAAIADCPRVYGFTARGGRFREGKGTLPGLAPEMLSHPGPIALVFGREDAGLRVEEYQLCHALVEIPTLGSSSSLNLSQAVMVTLYELCGRATDRGLASREQSRPKTMHLLTVPATTASTASDLAPTQETLITSEVLERLIQQWEGAMRAVGFDTFGPPDLMQRLMRRIRRVFFRARLQRDDSDMLFGVARRIQGLYRIPGSRTARKSSPPPT